jgi:hypothetical protein
MVEVKGLHFMYCGVTGISRPYSLCPVASQEYSSTNNKTKISKQSALAVHKHLRDNQHQSTGMFKFALA